MKVKNLKGREERDKKKNAEKRRMDSVDMEREVTHSGKKHSKKKSKNKQKKASTGKEYVVIAYCFVGIFLALIGYLVYFNVELRDDYANSPYNAKRQGTYKERVVKGAIIPEQGFVNGKYAMILMGPWNLKRFKDDLKLDFGIGLIPGGDAGTSSNVGGTDVVIFNDKSIERQKACYNFLTYFTNAQNQVEWCTKLNQLPINLGAYDLVKFEDQHQMAFMKQMKYASANPVIKDFGLLEDIVNPEVETVLAGSKTAKEAVESIEKRVQERLLNE